MHLSISLFAQHNEYPGKLTVHILLERRGITENTPIKNIKSYIIIAECQHLSNALSADVNFSDIFISLK